MTCIIGYVDLENKCVWVGGDSLGSDGFSKTVEGQYKVFRNDVLKNVVMGSTTSFRHIDLLKYSKELFDEIDFYKKEELNHKYMVTKFIPNLYRLFSNGIYDEEKKECGANFIIGAGLKLFEIQVDFSVMEPVDGFCAVGSGEYFALGSLQTTKDFDMDIPTKIFMALEAAEYYSCGVQRPFVLMNTSNDEVIIYNNEDDIVFINSNKEEKPKKKSKK